MISVWKTELEKHGYIYKKWSSSEKAYVKYLDNVLEHQIWEDRIPQRNNKIVINTFISVKDPFMDMDFHDYHVVLGGRLASGGVVIPRSDTGVGRFWSKDESSEALNTLLQYALPWFEANSSLEKLIEHVTNDVIVRSVSDKNRASRTWSFKDCFLSKFQNKQQEVEIKIRPINRLILSLLYYHSKNADLACEHAREWLKFVNKGGQHTGEPDRTIRQLKEMGCPYIEEL